MSYTSFICKNNQARENCWESLKSEISCLFKAPNEAYKFSKINNRLYQSNLFVLEADVAIKEVRKLWWLMEHSALKDDVFPLDKDKTRQQIVDTIALFRNSNNNNVTKYINLLNSSINSWSDMEEKYIIKLSGSEVSDSLSPLHHYFHMYLNVSWLLLTLRSNDVDASEQMVEQNVRDIIKDLVALSNVHFNKERQSDVLQKNAFVCPCVKNLWILLQLFWECVNAKGNGRGTQKTFWDLFNAVLDGYDDVFGLWLLSHIAAIQGFDESGVFVGPECHRVTPNYEFLERRLKAINNKCTSMNNETNNLLLTFCKLVEQLVNKWWTKKVKSEPLQVLWEIFYKHINTRFTDSDAVLKKPRDTIELLDQITMSASNSSYEYFIYLLSHHLSVHPNQWPRIRGRIYSKLSVNKINEASDIELYHIIILFLGLSSAGNLLELSDKLQSLLQNLSLERQQSALVWTAHLTLICLHVQGGLEISTVSKPILKSLQFASHNRDYFSNIRLYVDSFYFIMSLSTNYRLQQHDLLNNWIVKYALSCQHSDLCALISVLLSAVKKLKEDASVWESWEASFKCYVLPALKQVVASPTTPAEAGELAALILFDPSSQDIQTYVDDSTSLKISTSFVSTILNNVSEDHVVPKAQEALLLRVWVRHCLLTPNSNQTVHQKLTKAVLKLASLQAMCGVSIGSSTNPICSFIKEMGRYAGNNVQAKELLEVCFGGGESWVAEALMQPTSESQVVYMYTCIALLVFHCARLLYDKTRTNCVLSRLVNAFLLPMEVLMGRTPHPFVVGAIHRTWHRFMQGIYSLNSNGDAFLERTLKSLVVSYLPHFGLADNPMLKCLDHEGLATFILDKIALTFLGKSTKANDSSIAKALQTLQVAVHNTSSEKLKLIVNHTFLAILEIMLFNNTHKNLAAEVVKAIALSNCYDNVRECVKTQIITLTEKNLAFNTESYFNLVCGTLAKLIPEDVRAVMPDIRRQVNAVEKMRGIGYDNRLRQGLEKIQSSLSN